jgi:hypothetical protein
MIGKGFLPALWFATSLCLASSAASAAETAAAPEVDHFISKAVFAGGSLWLLTDRGHLSSVSPTDQRQVNAPIPGRVFDLWVQDGEPATLARESAKAPAFSIWRHTHGKWSPAAAIQRQDDEYYVGAGQTQGAVVILTNHRLITLRGRHQESLPVEWPPQTFPGQGSVLVTDFAVYVGANEGEWGGWIRAVDRSSGTVTELAKNFSDPVTGLAAEPNGCIAVSMGLIHMGYLSGGIGELCGEQAKMLYTKPVHDKETEPFFGICAAGGHLWAIGADGLYELSTDGTAQSVPMPKFVLMGNATVSFDLPDFALVLTTVNQHLSVSGATPLFAPR